MRDSVERFSSRVENYVKYRPHYPRGVLLTLMEECGLTPDSRVADIGSGPGQLAELFLENGNVVYAVEPNAAMREAAEQVLASYPGFRSLAGRAEETPLPDHSVDFVTAGQAFHWFDLEPSRAELMRILKPGGWAVLVWNERETGTTPLLIAYDQLMIRYGIDYPKVDHRNITPEILMRFFGPVGFHSKSFPNHQDFDHAALVGRMLSSSYTPELGHPNHAPMLAELDQIFESHQVNGRVRFDYTTTMYYGHLT
jgi:SAM-dependent methyltransferase